MFCSLLVSTRLGELEGMDEPCDLLGCCFLLCLLLETQDKIALSFIALMLL